MMRYIILLLLIFLAKATFALDMVQTKYGRLEIKSTGEYSYEQGLFLDSKLIFEESSYLDIKNLFHIGSSEVALISSNQGGSGTLTYYCFVKLTLNSQPMFLEAFGSQKGVINPIQKNDRITIDLGYNNGIHEVLTYQNGKQLIKKVKDKNKSGNDDDCNFLYNEIYLDYVKGRECNEAPEDIGGMSTVRAYHIISNDPHFDLKQLQSLSKISCNKNVRITYSEFKKKICGG